ncbi:type I-E CRISPR-associated protein Cse1/CasA [Saccharopolyspora sp. NPDC047091]|uniref:type I-E CRISPR-associated protein Cse1/CasA n=1 Tax=Saccharopolyspora sp. NPDC047091 TaxID=3155924 RepID=UPI0033D83C48
MRFDLLTEPWFPVVRSDGSATELGLAEVLLQAHDLRWIEAEAPVVTAALHRLLLALAHRAYGPPTTRRWESLWSARELPRDELEKYQQDFGDRFDLFGPRPFLQCPGLAEKAMGSAKQLLMPTSSGSNATLFHHTTSRDHVEVPAAAAARWMVALQAYDTGGLKTPFRKDKSSKCAVCNQFGAVVVEGATLKETLLLNLQVYAPGRGKPPGTTEHDRPQWELDEPPRPDPEMSRIPRGWTDVLTWPSRRILLRAVDRGGEPYVDRAVITPGDRFTEKLHEAEHQAAFRQPMKQNKKKEWKPDGEPRPIRLEELRGAWRYCRELLLAAPPENPRHRPTVLDHVAANAPEDAVYTLRIYGQALGAKAAVVHTWLQESVPAPVPLLRADESDDRVGPLLGLAADLADNIGWALERMEKKYEAAFALEKEHAERRSALAQWYWPELSAPFGVVLRDVGVALATEHPSPAAAQRALFDPFEQWAQCVRRISEQAVRTWVWNLPRESGRQLLALAEPESWFHAHSERLYREYRTDRDATWDSGQENDE